MLLLYKNKLVKKCIMIRALHLKSFLSKAISMTYLLAISKHNFIFILLKTILLMLPHK